MLKMGLIILEGIADAVMLVFVVIPGLVLVTLGTTCISINEGTGATGCALGALGTGLVENASGYLLMLAFGLIFIIGPIVAAAFVISSILKLIRYTKTGTSSWKWLYSMPLISVYTVIALFIFYFH